MAGAETCFETWALVPVKRFSQAKGRLASILSTAERARLAQSMLLDVLENLTTTNSLAGMAVVTADPEALAIARKFGAAAIFDPVEAGLNQAIQRGLDVLGADGRRVLVVPADIPFAEPDEFENVIALLEQTPVVLVPARYDGGTNALAMRSAELLPPQFGQESFKLHRGLARERGLGCSVLRSRGIGLDIDCPQDLERYLQSSENIGLTGSLLDELDIAERLGIKETPVPMRLF
jgi:2-phospho-L-lactate/phosphoenolpyruvate guanylyltransferase